MDQAGFVYLSMHGEFIAKVEPFSNATKPVLDINKAYFTVEKQKVKGAVAVKAIRTRSVVSALVNPDKATHYVLTKNNVFYSTKYNLTSWLECATLFSLKSPPVVLYFDEYSPVPVQVIDNIILDVFGDKQ